MSKPKIGIALGSGGARGWSHIGVLRALEDEGIVPDVIAGCSMGALVGAAYSAGELDFVEDWARSVSWRTIMSFLDVNLSSGGLIDGAHVESLINTISEDLQFSDLQKPLIAIASDLITGREVWLQEGAVLDAVRGSIAIPGIFAPKKLGNKLLLDGGMTNPVPVSACRAMGADIVIAVDPPANALQTHAPTSPPEDQGTPPIVNDTALLKRLGIDEKWASVSDKIMQSVVSITPDILGWTCRGIVPLLYPHIMQQRRNEMAPQHTTEFRQEAVRQNLRSYPAKYVLNCLSMSGGKLQVG